MANLLKLSVLLQNKWDGRGTNEKVIHRIPEFETSLSDKGSVVLSLTGTGSHTLVNDATNFNYNAGTILKDPITGDSVQIDGNVVAGFAVYVKRAVAGTAPTGYVKLANSGFNGWVSDGNIHLYENAYFLCHNPSGPVTSDSTGLTIDLSSSTGYNVLLIAYSDQA